MGLPGFNTWWKRQTELGTQLHINTEESILEKHPHSPHPETFSTACRLLDELCGKVTPRCVNIRPKQQAEYSFVCDFSPCSRLRGNAGVMRIRFDWDKDKNEFNQRKHKINFEEAKTVFYDPSALLIYDPDHSEVEDRFIIMGMSQNLKILVVCHFYRSKGEIIRIISARKANKDEIKQYGG